MLFLQDILVYLFNGTSKGRNMARDGGGSRFFEVKVISFLPVFLGEPLAILIIESLSKNQAYIIPPVSVTVSDTTMSSLETYTQVSSEHTHAIFTLADSITYNTAANLPPLATLYSSSIVHRAP
jgi:hypothetical protein